MVSYIIRAAPRLSPSPSVLSFTFRSAASLCTTTKKQPTSFNQPQQPLLHTSTTVTASPVPQASKTSFLRRFFNFGSPPSPEDIMAAKTKAQEIIDNNPVAVFSKSYCPYCTQSKKLLSELGVKPYIIELDQVEDGTKIQEALQEITGQRTVPNIFINKQHIGGNSDLQGKKGELPTLLKDAGAL